MDWPGPGSAHPCSAGAGDRGARQPHSAPLPLNARVVWAWRRWARELGGTQRGGGWAGAPPPTRHRQKQQRDTRDHRSLWAGGQGTVGGGASRDGQGRWRGGALSALWFGVGREMGRGTFVCPSIRLSVYPACLSARPQSFHSFLMVRFHSQDRWSVLSSSVKRDLML